MIKGRMKNEKSFMRPFLLKQALQNKRIVYFSLFNMETSPLTYSV